MDIREKLDKDKFIVTCEITPPKGTDILHAVKFAEKLKLKADAFNVTDNQRSVMRLSSLALSVALKQRGLEPIMQVTCRDRNRLAIQSDLLGAKALGVANILALTGDHPSSGDHPQAKPVFDLDSVQLIETISMLNTGHTLSGYKLSAPTNFFIGAVLNPFSSNPDLEIIKLKKKSEHGALFFQTQVVYDPAGYIEFIKKIKHLNLKIIAGVMPVRSIKMAEFISKKIPGIKMPESIIEEIRSSSDPHETGKKQVLKIIEKIRPYCDGVHIISSGCEKVIMELLEAL